MSVAPYPSAGEQLPAAMVPMVEYERVCRERDHWRQTAQERDQIIQQQAATIERDAQERTAIFAVFKTKGLTLAERVDGLFTIFDARYDGTKASEAGGACSPVIRSQRGRARSASGVLPPMPVGRMRSLGTCRHRHHEGRLDSLAGARAQVAPGPYPDGAERQGRHARVLPRATQWAGPQRTGAPGWAHGRAGRRRLYRGATIHPPRVREAVHVDRDVAYSNSPAPARAHTIPPD